MNRNLIFLLLVIVSTVNGLKSSSDEQECRGNIMKKIDGYFNEMNFVPSSNKKLFPDSLEKLRDACK